MPRFYGMLTGLVLLAGCAKHAPEPTPHPSTPHITWSIAQGSGDKQVCTSNEGEACTLVLSDRPANRRLGVFHLFLHAAAVNTKYAGSMTIGFLGQPGTSDRVFPIERVIPRGSNPMNFSSTGLVKSPGTYYVDVSLTATPAVGSGTPVPLNAHIKVDVR